MCTKIMGIFRMYKVFNKNISNRFYFKHYIIDNQYSILYLNGFNIFIFIILGIHFLRLKLCTLNERLKDTSFSFISSLITFLHNYFTAF